MEFQMSSELMNFKWGAVTDNNSDNNMNNDRADRRSPLTSKMEFFVTSVNG